VAADEPVIVNTILAGWREFVVAANAEKEAMRELGLQVGWTGKEGVLLGKRFNVANQAMFTARRLAYGTTLAVVGAGVAALHMGWSYRSAMQEASVALQPVFRGTQGLKEELGSLFRIAAFTPFQFKDITVAFRQMYGAFHPLGISVATTNQTIRSMTDALAFVGRSSPGALNRVAVALQHMAFQGRLTGQTVLQLARDGLPIYAALTTELGLTADQMHHVGALGIPALDALNAINKYISTTPGYMNAALRQSTQTLSGAFATFKDLLSQAVGGSQSGFFGGIQSFFQRVDLALAPFYSADKPITLTAFIKAVDQILSPKTHVVLNFFQLLNGIILGFTQTLKGFSTALTFVTHQLGFMTGNGNRMGLVFKWLGRIMGTLLGIWLLYRVYLIAARLAELTYTSALVLKNSVVLISILLTNAEARAQAAEYFMLRFKLIPAIIRGVAALRLYALALIFGGRQGRMWINMTRMERAIVKLRFGLIGLVAWTKAAAVATWEFTAALLANPITWIVLAVIALTAGIVILYFKWKWFHDLVNNTFNWFIHQSPAIKFAILMAFGPLGYSIAMIYGLIKAIQLLIRWIHMIHWPHPPGWFTFSGKDAIALAGHGISAAFAGGGHMTQRGYALVGERGPEILALPGGAAVSPMEKVSFQAPSFPKYIELHSNIYLGRDKIAKAVTKHKLDAEARE
jgi:tape measure domain-containing protein